MRTYLHALIFFSNNWSFLNVVSLYWCWSKLLAEQIIIELQSGSARELKILPNKTLTTDRERVWVKYCLR